MLAKGRPYELPVFRCTMIRHGLQGSSDAPRRAEPLSEASMLSAEARIPELAAQAGRNAHARALATAGRVLMRSADGKLVERHASGKVVVIGQLPAGTAVLVGSVLKRARNEHLKNTLEDRESAEDSVVKESLTTALGASEPETARQSLTLTVEHRRLPTAENSSAVGSAQPAGAVWPP